MDREPKGPRRSRRVGTWIKRRSRLRRDDVRAFLPAWLRYLRRRKMSPLAFLHVFIESFQAGRALVRGQPELRASYWRGVGLVGAGLATFSLAAVPGVAWERLLWLLLPSWIWFAGMSVYVASQLALVRRPRRGRTYDRFMAANTLTLFRLLGIPFLAFGVLLSSSSPSLPWVVLALYLAMVLTDMTDGWVARRFDQTSDWGRIWDHVTDFLAGSAVTVALGLTGRFPSWLVVLVLVRFLLPVLGGGWLYVRSMAWRIEPSVVGKVTVLSLSLLGLLVLVPGLRDSSTGAVAVDTVTWLSTVLTGGNLIFIIRRGLQILRSTDEEITDPGRET